jgi:hypothetical protein
MKRTNVQLFSKGAWNIINAVGDIFGLYREQSVKHYIVSRAIFWKKIRTVLTIRNSQSTKVESFKTLVTVEETA